jgi:Ca-activated chloride channel family protein
MRSDARRTFARLALASALCPAAVGAARQQAPPPPQQTPPPAPAQQQPVFRTGVETVAIYATVLDPYDELVKSLQRDDFEVYDEGKLQELTNFELGLQPITAILMVDTSDSMTLNIELAKAAAEQFVIRMLPGDKVRVGSFSDAITISPEFTSDRDALLRDIRDRLHLGRPTRLWDAVDQTMTDLAPLGGRRILVLFTDGEDTYSKKRAADVFDRARSDELMVYTVQFRSTPLARRHELSVLPNPSWKASLTEDVARNPPAGEGLRRLSSQTGGGSFALLAYDDLGATFTRMTEELHFQYVLGFSPQKLDGKVHSLEVKVRNQPRVVVRARANYFAPKRPVNPGRP